MAIPRSSGYTGTKARGLPVVFPVHPRTAKNLRDLDSKTPQLNYVDPLGYLEFNYLIKHARGVNWDERTHWNRSG